MENTGKILAPAFLQGPQPLWLRGRGSPSEGARRLQTFLALCTCLVSKQEEFLHVLPGSSDTAPHGVETSIYSSPSVWQRSPGSGCFLALPK